MWHRYKAIKWFEVVSVKYYVSDLQKTLNLNFCTGNKSKTKTKNFE